MCGVFLFGLVAYASVNAGRRRSGHELLQPKISASPRRTGRLSQSLGLFHQAHLTPAVSAFKRRKYPIQWWNRDANTGLQRHVSHFQFDTWRFFQNWPTRDGQNRLEKGPEKGKTLRKREKCPEGRRFWGCFLHFKKGKSVRYVPAAAVRVLEETWTFGRWKQNGDNRRCHLSFLSKWKWRWLFCADRLDDPSWPVCCGV